MEHIDRPKFREIRYAGSSMLIPPKYDVVESKMDGIWGCLILEKGYYRMYSRTGKIKAVGEIPKSDRFQRKCILLGEFMHGSAWGHRKDIDKDFFIFDCVTYDGEWIGDRTDRSRTVYSKRLMEYLRDRGFEWVRDVYRYKVDNWQSLWDSKVQRDGYEGLIFKDSDAHYGDKDAWMRMKAEVEIDYICKGMGDADEKSKYAGMVGSVIGTLYNKDCEVKCSGLSEEDRKLYTELGSDFIGKVFTANGNGWYPSGAIRHPKIVRWRDDKIPEECTYEQIPQEIREEATFTSMVSERK